MIRQLIHEHSNRHNVQQWVIEKDYSISYLLKAISMTDDLGDAYPRTVQRVAGQAEFASRDVQTLEGRKSTV